MVYPTLQSTMRPIPHCKELLDTKVSSLRKEHTYNIRRNMGGHNEETDTEFGNLLYKVPPSNLIYLLSRYLI